ncbi:MAG: carbon-phosphorus lyase complex subunit PhnI [Chloroflexales bacterium]|nr:carbon-phosphorus lyase complex subunit PhnI [Chloroflexales bacterium]
MAYVAARGGEQAIQQAEELFRRLTGPIDAGLVEAIGQHMPYLVDRVMGESSLYAPQLAALALAQTGGDLYEAVLLLRAYRSTQPRLAYAAPVDAAATQTLRRISAAFKDIPGGQILGPTLDYSHRLLRSEVLDGMGEVLDERAREGTALPETLLPPVADWLRLNGLLAPLGSQEEQDPAALPDITREAPSFPAPRAHRLQALARADSGGVLALGYASMRGYGLIHPTVNEIRLGYADVLLEHPISGARFSAGRIRVSQAEVVSAHGGELELGFAATMGWNEVKVIAAAMLDLEMEKPDPHPAHAEEFVLTHTEPVEASGFCIHYKLPHYVTFSSNLDALRRVRALASEGEAAAVPVSGGEETPA